MPAVYDYSNYFKKKQWRPLGKKEEKRGET
jgi:hypothetical protein